MALSSSSAVPAAFFSTAPSLSLYGSLLALLGRMAAPVTAASGERYYPLDAYTVRSDGVRELAKGLTELPAAPAAAAAGAADAEPLGTEMISIQSGKRGERSEERM